MLLAADTRPAGGAAIGEVILATALGAGLTALLLGLVFLHRTRRTTIGTGKVKRAHWSSAWPGALVHA